MNSSDIRVRLRAVLVRKRVEEDLNEELAFHIEMQARKNAAEGMCPPEANRLARIQFGVGDTAKEECRDARGVQMYDELVRNIMYTFRNLRRDAGFTTLAILIAGLGIGASATVFSIVNTLLLRSLPFTEPDRLVWIGNGSDDGVAEWTLQVDHVLDLRRQTRSFSDLQGYFGFSQPGDSKLSGDGQPVSLTGVQVSCGLLPLLGVKPVVGNQFTTEQCKWNGPGAVLLTYGLWKTRYSSDPSIVGRKLIINNSPVAVVGVLPESFDFAGVFEPGVHYDLFTPFPLTEETNKWGNTLRTVGRLKPDATLAGAQAEFAILTPRITRQHPERNSLRPVLRSLDEHVNGRFRPALFALACAVGVVMLIVCANLASLQMARAATRQKEMAIRVALGAGRGRLIRQMLTESMILAGLGIVPGLILAVAGTSAFAHLQSFNIPLLSSVHVDSVALIFTVALALLTGLVVGLAAALQAPAVAIHETLKDSNRGTDGGGRHHTFIRSTLVVTEISFACVLLVGTGLLVRSFLRVLDVTLGFQPESTAAIRIDPGQNFPTQSARDTYLTELLRIARSTTGVNAAGITDALPFDSGEISWSLIGKGQVFEQGHYPEVYIRRISEGYLHTAGISLVAGRDFTANDTASSDKVAIINQTLTRTLWPGQNAIGQVVDQDGGRRVVGIVADTRHKALEEAAGSEMYMPMRQRTDLNGIELVVRSSLPPAALAPTIRAALTPLDPSLAANEFRTLQQLVDRAASPRRFIALLLAGFSAFALILAALGIYALISYSVSQRTQEFGIRTALGAGAFDLQSRVLFQTLSLAAIGVVIGLGASWLLARSLTSLLFGVTPTDPMTFASMIALLGAVATAAGYLPARRASTVDPMTALRAD
jgi:predicted permease